MEQYREYRQATLRALCFIAKTQHPAAQDIVGFATDLGLDAINRSEDLAWVDARVWTVEDQEHWLRVQKETGFLTNVRMSRTSVKEFPEIAQRDEKRRRKIGRNQLCTCGIGKKYKKCHGA